MANEELKQALLEVGVDLKKLKELGVDLDREYVQPSKYYKKLYTIEHRLEIHKKLYMETKRKKIVNYIMKNYVKHLSNRYNKLFDYIVKNNIKDQTEMDVDEQMAAWRYDDFGNMGLVFLNDDGKIPKIHLHPGYEDEC